MKKITTISWVKPVTKYYKPTIFVNIPQITEGEVKDLSKLLNSKGNTERLIEIGFNENHIVMRAYKESRKFQVYNREK